MSVRDDVMADNDGHWSRQEIDAGSFVNQHRTLGLTHI
jgi:hypothetical protein